MDDSAVEHIRVWFAPDRELYWFNLDADRSREIRRIPEPELPAAKRAALSRFDYDYADRVDHEIGARAACSRTRFALFTMTNSHTSPNVTVNIVRVEGDNIGAIVVGDNAKECVSWRPEQRERARSAGEYARRDARRA